jgi:hypothetical protein
MGEIYFGDFRSFIIQYIKQIDKMNYESDSIEWFLLKYLRRIVHATEGDNAPGRVEGAIRFYIDNLDEQSELVDHCIKIYEAYRKTLRYGQTQ